MSYPHKLSVVSLPIPPKTIQVKIETDTGDDTHNKEFYATPKEFLEFWKPLVDFYEKVREDEQRNTN